MAKNERPVWKKDEVYCKPHFKTVLWLVPDLWGILANEYTIVADIIVENEDERRMITNNKPYEIYNT